MSGLLVIDDEMATRLITPSLAIDAMEATLEEAADGGLVAPPRFHVETPRGRLTYTAGASTDRFGVNGFRVYPVYPGGESGADEEQLVAVYDDRSGRLRGICVGQAIGLWRTAAIDAVAIDHLARADATSLGVLGAGRHASAHARLALHVRSFTHVRIYNRTRTRAEHLARTLRAAHPEVQFDVADDAASVAAACDVLICATSSGSPLFDAAQLQAGTHVSTVGPKFVNRHELDSEVGRRADILVTDAPAQLADYWPRHFLASVVDLGSIESLGARLLAGAPRDPEALSVFLSVGLAGSEVCLAAAVLAAAVTSEP